MGHDKGYYSNLFLLLMSLYKPYKKENMEKNYFE